jgi:hypothetical protein
MSKSDGVRRYADEATRWAHQLSFEKRRMVRSEIAQTRLNTAALRDGALFIDAQRKETTYANYLRNLLAQSRRMPSSLRA